MKNTTSPTPKRLPKFISSGTFIWKEFDGHSSSDIHAVTIHSNAVVAYYINTTGATPARLEAMQAELLNLVARQLVRGDCLALLNNEKAAA